jgi:hypothetical protein
MDKRLRQARFAIDPKGQTFAEIHCDVLVGEKWYPEDPVALEVAGPVATAFATQFGAAQQAEIARLTAELEVAVQQREVATEQITTLQSRVAELAETREQLAIAQQSLSEANAKIAELQNALPWDVRIIDATAFVARVTPTELLDLAGSSDPLRQQIAQMLVAYRANDWPIMLDSPEMQQAFGYLVSSGAITEQRAAELRRDSTREEAYKAGD